MVNPVPGYRITTGYGVPGSWCGGSHKAVDYAAPTGTNVVAAVSGVVTGTSWGSSFGIQVVIDNDRFPDGSPGLWACYAHLSSKNVSTGQRVSAGQVIGKVGSTGNSTGPHLHFEVQGQANWVCGGGREPSKWINAGGSTPAPPPSGCYGDYCYGQNRDAHRALQRRLAEKGFQPDWGSGPTTYYGDSTKNSLAAWQRSQGWSGSGADGLPGPQTLQRLGLPEKFQYRQNKQVYQSKMWVGQGDSDSVWNVQIALLLRGYSIPNGPTDYFGEQTKAAVAQFQRDQGWSGSDADGIPGPGTVRNLGLTWVADAPAPAPPEPEPEPEPTPPPGGELPDRPEVFFPDAEWDPIEGLSGLRPFASGGGAKVTVHTTETDVKPNWHQQRSGIPHFTIDCNTGDVWQHLALDTAAYTLKGGEHSPNSGAGVNIQVECIGRAKDVPNYDAAWYGQLKTLLLWIVDQIDAPYVFPFPFAGQGDDVRQGWDDFRDAAGIVGHGHATYNDHWDPGALNIELLYEDDPEPPPPPVENPYLTKAEFDAWRKRVAEAVVSDG